MSQQPPQDWSGWANFAWGLAAPPVIWVYRRLSNAVQREEWRQYLEARDKVSDQRHSDNLDKLEKISDELKSTHGRLCTIEGWAEAQATGRHQQP